MPEVGHTRIAVAEGVELDVFHAGDPSNKTVILSHGFPELAYSWRHQMAAVADAGYHVLAPNQRGYGHSSAPTEVEAYGIRHLTGDLFALLDHFGKEHAAFVGHDWGAMIVWECARLQPQRVSAVVGVSVPFVQWPAPPTQLMKMVYGDHFFYILYFQPVGPAEKELGANPRLTSERVMWGASGAGFRIPTEMHPMEGTGFLTHAPDAPALPWTGPEGEWLSETDMAMYASEFTHSGYFGPVSYYRNLDATYEITKDLGAERLTMPSYFIGGSKDLVMVMDPTGIERMQTSLPDFRGHTMIDGVGHWTQQEAPHEFNGALIRFLDSL